MAAATNGRQAAGIRQAAGFNGRPQAVEGRQGITAGGTYNGRQAARHGRQAASGSDYVMIFPPFCHFCRSLANIWILAYIGVCLYAYIPIRLYIKRLI